MSAWHGDAEMKARIVERMKAHREADDFIQRVYQKLDPTSALGYRGCAIGCLLDKQEWRARDGEDDNEPEEGWHQEVENQFGIDADVAYLIDECFESCRTPEHAQFAVDAIEAIAVGADLTGVADAYAERHGHEHSPGYLLDVLRSAPLPAATDASS